MEAAKGMESADDSEEMYMNSLENAIGYLNKAVNILPDSMAIIFNERGLVYELMDSLELEHNLIIQLFKYRPYLGYSL